ncbi:MAG: RNA polymerase sigma factor [Myxococcota bacterium]
MRAAQRGDQAAYEKLLREVLPVLRSYVGFRLRDSSRVEDVVQEVLISVHRARHTYQSGRPFGGWLRAIARNAVIDAQRARMRRIRRELAVAESTAAAEIDERPSLTSRVGAPLSPSLRRALESLPPAQRQAVESIQIHELTVAEAAEKAGISPGALRVRAHRGYKALRAILGERERE